MHDKVTQIKILALLEWNLAMQIEVLLLFAKPLKCPPLRFLPQLKRKRSVIELWCSNHQNILTTSIGMSGHRSDLSRSLFFSSQHWHLDSKLPIFMMKWILENLKVNLTMGFFWGPQGIEGG